MNPVLKYILLAALWLALFIVVPEILYRAFPAIYPLLFLLTGVAIAGFVIWTLEYWRDRSFK